MKDLFIFSSDFGCSDINKTISQYETLFSFARDSKIDNLILGGDLAPHSIGKDLAEEINFQKIFYLSVLTPLVANHFKNIPNSKIYLIPGNNDFAFSFELFEEQISKIKGNPFVFINGHRVPLSNKIDLVGYSFIPISPFGLKDWEKFDIPLRKGFSISNILQEESSTEGFRTRGGNFEVINFNTKKISDTIEQDLSKSTFTLNPKKTIYVMHCPPKLTNLDRLYYADGKKHVGSLAIREFIEIQQPYATFHGHIHETVDVAKDYKQIIGDSISYSVGNGVRKNPASNFFLSALTFNLKDVHKTLERKLIPLKN